MPQDSADSRHGGGERAFLPEFTAAHNRRFGVAPREAEDARRPVLHDADELALMPRPVPRA